MPYIRKRYTLFALLPALLISVPGKGQNLFGQFQSLLTAPLSYTVTYTANPPVIDGDINDAAWQQARWTADFQDIEGSIRPKPTYQTKVKMLWGDSCLYIAAQLQEPHVWANLKQHDEVVFHDNDFEVFIDPRNTTHQYFEIEVNALNTLFDLFLNKPYRNGGVPLSSWDAPGIRSAIKIQGTLNNPNDKDKGWTVEMAIPYTMFGMGRYGVPQEGALWRINFSRVEWDTQIVDGRYVKTIDSAGRTKPEHNWVWSPQSVINMHYPERWGYLQFSKQTQAAFVLPYAEEQKKYLWLIYYKQREYWNQHKAYATNLNELNIPDMITIANKDNELKMEATAHQYIAFIADENDKMYWAINQEGLIQRIMR